MDKDLRDTLSALNARHAKYVVVGGYAVGVHAQPRVTKDLDVFIAADRENAESVYRLWPISGHPSQTYPQQISSVRSPSSGLVFLLSALTFCNKSTGATSKQFGPQVSFGS